MRLVNPRGRRPATPTGINWAHPRSAGLAFFAPLSTERRDLVSLRTPTVTGNEVFEANGAGLFRKFGTGQYLDYPATPPAIGATTPFTVAWTQQPRATSAYSTVLEVNFGSGTQSFVIYLAAADSSYYFTAGPRVPSGAQSWSSAIGAVTNGVLDRYVLRGAGGSQSTTSSDWTLYRNGVVVTRGTATTYGSVTSAAFRIGALANGGPDVFEGLIGDMRMWSRALSDQEMGAESMLAGAAELYAPRVAVLPLYVASGPVTHTTTGALAADAATVAGSAVHPHTTTGALAADSATISGAALHPHTTSGALAADAATVSGSATLTPLPVTHTTTGALIAQDATLSGGAARPSAAVTTATGGWGAPSYRGKPTPEETQAEREALGIVTRRATIHKPEKRAKPAAEPVTEAPESLRGQDLAIWAELLNQDIRRGIDSVPASQLDAMQYAHAQAMQRLEDEDMVFIIVAVAAAVD